MILDEMEIRRITGFVRTDAQARELGHLGIAFKVRRDGSLLVFESDLNPQNGRNIVTPEPQLHL